MYYVYILKSSQDNKFYTGQTVDLENRLRQHDKGSSATKSTLSRGPFQLMHVEMVDTLTEALRLEKYFKSGSGREVRDEIIHNY